MLKNVSIFALAFSGSVTLWGCSSDSDEVKDNELIEHYEDAAKRFDAVVPDPKNPSKTEGECVGIRKDVDRKAAIIYKDREDPVKTVMAKKDSNPKVKPAAEKMEKAKANCFAYCG